VRRREWQVAGYNAIAWRCAHRSQLNAQATKRVLRLMLLRRAYKIHINLDSVAYVELCAYMEWRCVDSVAYMEWRCVEQKPVETLEILCIVSQ